MFNVVHQFHKSTFLVCKNEGKKKMLILIRSATTFIVGSSIDYLLFQLIHLFY